VLQQPVKQLERVEQPAGADPDGPTVPRRGDGTVGRSGVVAPQFFEPGDLHSETAKRAQGLSGLPENTARQAITEALFACFDQEQLRQIADVLVVCVAFFVVVRSMGVACMALSAVLAHVGKERT
jgi:hypothetical protein